MVPHSPIAALGTHASDTRDLAIEVVQHRHELAAGAHEMAESRYSIGFGAQWRDLLEDIRAAFGDRGCKSHEIRRGSYRLPIVNGCLVFVWRVPETTDAVSRFASSKTRRSAFFAEQPVDLFGTSFIEGAEDFHDADEEAELARALQLAGQFMPVVLVMVHSTPRQLLSISWAVAEYVGGQVQLHGKETIWKPDFAAATAATEVEAFDSGVPAIPVLELQVQDGAPDA